MPRANLEPKQHRALLRRYGGRCQACGRRKDIQLDHVIPVNCGGSDHPSNLQPLCWRCNKDKGDRTIDYRG